MAQFYPSDADIGTNTGQYVFQTDSASGIALVAKGVAGQTANVFEVQNSLGTTLFSVDDDGNVTYLGDETIADSLTVTGAIVGLSTLNISGLTTLDTLSAGATDLSSLSVTGTTAFTGDVVANHNLTVNNTIQANGLSYFNYLFLNEQAAGPSAVPNKGAIYTKEVSSNTEFFFRDSTGNEVQITSGGGVGGGAYFTPDDTYYKMGNTAASPDAQLGWNTTQTVDGVFLGLLAANNTFIIAENADVAYDFAHAAQTNPTLYIQSANQSATEWISISHNQTNGVIDVGTGVVSIPDGISTSTGVFSGAVSGITTLGCTGDVTISGNTASITHSGTTTLTIVSTSGSINVESVNFSAGAISSVTSITDGTASWTGNSLSSFTSISGTTLTDGTASLTGGDWTGIGTMAVGGDITTSNAIGRDTDNEIAWTTDDQLDITIGGSTTGVVSISTGAGDNDKLVTQGYVDDAVATVDTWAEVLALGNTSGATDVIISNGQAIKSTDTNGQTMLLKANDTTFITFTTNATDTCSIGDTTNRILDGWFTDLTVTNAIAGSVTGNAGTVTNGVYTTDNLSALSATTSAQLAGVISDETGSGALVFGTAPTFTTSITVTDGGVIDADGIDLVTGNDYQINNTSVLNATTLGSAVVTSSLTTVGALASGSIASGFGTISTGNTITTTADLTGLTVKATGDTSAGDTSALGYTATEGAILTGQGSTNDITLKNDADAQVLAIPTGTTTVQLGVDGTASKLQLTEKASIALDDAGGADGDYSGITFTGTAGETIAFGEMVYLKAADSEWYKTDADASATAGPVAVAIAVSTGSDGNPVTLLTHGIVRADAVFPALTVGATCYLDTETAGYITNTAPSGDADVVRAVGHALTANEILVNISPDYIIVTA